MKLVNEMKTKIKTRVYKTSSGNEKTRYELTFPYPLAQKMELEKGDTVHFKEDSQGNIYLEFEKDDKH